MHTPIDCIIVDEGNREAAEAVIEITQAHDRPQELFLSGPTGSGKTALLKARFAEKDLLSTKKVSYYTCAELPVAMREGVSDVFLDWLGTVDVLLLDDVDGFLEDEELGPKMCELLLEERHRNGLDTAVSSSKPLSHYDDGPLAGVFGSFLEIEITPLGAEGRKDFIRSLVDDYATTESPKLSEGAIAFLANDLHPSLDTADRATKFLMTNYLGEPGRTLSRTEAETALR